MVGIYAFRVFMRTILNIEPYSPLKQTKVGFIFIGPNSSSRAEGSFQSRDTSCRQSWVEDWVLKSIGFKEFRLEPKFLNCGLCTLKPLSDQ